MNERELLARVLDLAVEIQQIPSPTFAEYVRAAFLAERFREERLDDVEIDELGNVYARLPGAGPARPVVVSAHSDSVFPTGTDLSVARAPDRITGPGIGDNALGLAGLFGLVWGLRVGRENLPGDLWLVADVGEEGLGDLRGMRAVVERFGRKPLAYLVLEAMAYGRVYHRGLGVRRYRITCHTPGGHSWVDRGVPSAVHELANFVARCAALKLPETPRTILNVGTISGGTSVNTVAGEAHLELDLRSEEVDALARLCERVEKLAMEIERKEVQVEVEVIGDRSVGELPTDHPLVRLARVALERRGEQARLDIGSTDANIPLSLGLSAICVGLTRGGNAHTTSEYILTAPLADGLAQVVEIVSGVFARLASNP